MAVAKVTLNGTTLMDTTDATASADKILNTYTAYIKDGTKAVGTATSSEFVVTLTYNTTSEMWEPDCTYAEVLAAYNTGKTITVQCDSQSVQNYVVADGYYSATEEALNYIVSETGYDSEHNVDVLRLTPYYLTSDGVGSAEGTQYIIPSDYKQITANGSSIDVTYCSEIDVAVPSSTPTLQSKTATPTEQQQTITPDTGYDGLSSVSVGAISSTYVGSGITRRSSSDLTASGATVTAPSGYYESSVSKSVASGTAGTPTATKGSVSNHAVSVTPSVTNTIGYITGGTKTGTAVTISASELVSGSQTITDNGTTDVTNLASVTVAVPYVKYYTGTSAPSSSLGSNGDIYLRTS